MLPRATGEDEPLGRRPSTGNIELRHLRYFHAVVEEMSFSQAAERLDIAQPGLSQQVKTLEEILRVTLLDRSRRKLRLTPAGKVFAADVRRILMQVERATQTAQRAARGEIGRLAIGYVASAAYAGVLTRLVGAFRDSHPQVDLEISEMEMLPQIDALAQGVLDIGFIRPPVPMPAGIATVTVLMEHLMIALPGVHAHAADAEVALADLREDVFITPQHPPQVSFNAHTVDACALAGFQPRMGPQGRDFMTIASMVSVGLGVALVPQSVQCIQLPNVAYRTVAGSPPKGELVVAYRRGEPSVAVQNFVQMARQAVRQDLLA
jgi:DNA-binding transcriptional LysR family regulator